MGEPLADIKFLRVARMGAKLLVIKVDYLRLGEGEGLELKGERLSYFLGEIMRCCLTILCVILLGFVVISELLQLLGWSELIDSS